MLNYSNVKPNSMMDSDDKVPNSIFIYGCRNIAKGKYWWFDGE